ncbi:hypothetical protein xavtCFBP7764_06115 [Xanthomonas citri]|nr:hypothetical protein xavtCFBP7764_06115 [Xanthomonas citri]
MRRVPRRWAGKGLAAKYQIDRSMADPSKKVVHQLLRLAVPPPPQWWAGKGPHCSSAADHMTSSAATNDSDIAVSAALGVRRCFGLLCFRHQLQC